MLPINFTAVLVSAVVMFIIGFLWHGPLFGKTFMKLAGIHPTGNEKFSDMYGQLFWNLVSNLVLALVLAGVIAFFKLAYSGMQVTALHGAIIGFWIWLALMTATGMDVIWMGRSKKYWLFEGACTLFSLLAMGAVLGGW